MSFVQTIEVQFASREEAERNSARPETGEWASQLAALIHGQATYRNLTEQATTERN